MQIGENGYEIKPRNTGKMRTQSQIQIYWTFSFTLPLFLFLVKENFKEILKAFAGWCIFMGNLEEG